MRAPNSTSEHGERTGDAAGYPEVTSAMAPLIGRLGCGVILTVRNVSTSLGFWHHQLGFSLHARRVNPDCAVVGDEGVVIMLQASTVSPEALELATELIHLEFPAADLTALAQRVRSFESGPAVVPTMRRVNVCGAARRQLELTLRDPDGYRVRFVQTEPALA